MTNTDKPATYTTRGVLAGVYKGKRLDYKNTLTHSVNVDDVGDDTAPALCGQRNLCDYIEAPQDEQPPTCPKCLRKDPRFKPVAFDRTRTVARTKMILANERGKANEFTRLHAIMVMMHDWETDDAIAFGAVVDTVMIAARLDELMGRALAKKCCKCQASIADPQLARSEPERCAACADPQ